MFYILRLFGFKSLLLFIVEKKPQTIDFSYRYCSLLEQLTFHIHVHVYLRTHMCIYLVLFKIQIHPLYFGIYPPSLEHLSLSLSLSLFLSL